MKRYLKYLLSLFALILIISGIPSTTIHASVEGNGDGGGDGDIDDGGGGGKGGPGSASKVKSGWLFYVTDSMANPKTSVKFVSFNGSSGVSTIYLKTRNSTYAENETRTIKQLIASYSGINWEVPAVRFIGDNSSGRQLKNHFVTDPDGDGPIDAYALQFIAKLWGDTVYNDFIKNYKDRYLVAEVVVWHGKTAETPINYAVTSWTALQCFGSTAGRWFWNVDTKYLPHASYLPTTWAIYEGVRPNFNKNESASDLLYAPKGFGMLLVRGTEVVEPKKKVEAPPTITASTTNDYLMANELNWVFPDLISDSSDMRAEDEYTQFFHMGQKSIWNQHVGEKNGEKYRADSIMMSRQNQNIRRWAISLWLTGTKAVEMQ